MRRSNCLALVILTATLSLLLGCGKARLSKPTNSQTTRPASNDYDPFDGGDTQDKDHSQAATNQSNRSENMKEESKREKVKTVTRMNRAKGKLRKQKPMPKRTVTQIEAPSRPTPIHPRPVHPKPIASAPVDRETKPSSPPNQGFPETSHPGTISMIPPRKPAPPPQNPEGIPNDAPGEVPGDSSNDVQDDVPEHRPVFIDLTQIGANKLSIDDHFRLKVQFGESWYEFSHQLPKNDLSGFSTLLQSETSLKAQLICSNPDCTQSQVALSQTKSSPQSAKITLNYLKFRTARGDVLKNCKVPLFFKYESDPVLRENPNVLEDILSANRLTSAYATLSSTSTWNGYEFEYLRIELFKEGSPALSLHDFKRTGARVLSIEDADTSSALSISYQLVGDGPSLTVDDITFRYALTRPSDSEICFHLPLIPDSLTANAAAR